MKKNRKLNSARKNKNNEFYTQLADIERELFHYKDYFRNKIVFCNCDNPEHSMFWKHFEINFDFLGLKKLVSIYIDKEKPTYKLEKTKEKVTKTRLKQNGDFRSPESIEILKESDVIVTNPPFSLFREYMAQLMEYKKKFIIIGNLNAVGYKNIFPLLKENKIWLGNSRRGMEFKVPETDEFYGSSSSNRVDEDGNKFATIGTALWITNVPNSRKNEELILYEKYDEKKYPKYDNCNAINVNKTKEIPKDYKGLMGVPISFINKHNPNQFEIVGIRKGDDNKDLTVNGKKLYYRILIKIKTFCGY